MRPHTFHTRTARSCASRSFATALETQAPAPVQRERRHNAKHNVGRQTQDLVDAHAAYGVTGERLAHVFATAVGDACRGVAAEYDCLANEEPETVVAALLGLRITNAALPMRWLQRMVMAHADEQCFERFFWSRPGGCGLVGVLAAARQRLVPLLGDDDGDLQGRRLGALADVSPSVAISISSKLLDGEALDLPSVSAVINAAFSSSAKQSASLSGAMLSRFAEFVHDFVALAARALSRLDVPQKGGDGDGGLDDHVGLGADLDDVQLMQRLAGSKLRRDRRATLALVAIYTEHVWLRDAAVASNVELKTASGYLADADVECLRDLSEFKKLHGLGPRCV